jgi:hypothetical protein
LVHRLQESGPAKCRKARQDRRSFGCSVSDAAAVAAVAAAKNVPVGGK